MSHSKNHYHTCLKVCIFQTTNINNKKKRIDVIKLVYFLDYNTCILGFGSLQVIPFCTNLVLANQGQLNDIAVVSYSFRKDEYTQFNSFQTSSKEVIWRKKCHALDKKCHFDNFAERAGMALPC